MPAHTAQKLTRGLMLIVATVVTTAAEQPSDRPVLDLRRDARSIRVGEVVLLHITAGTPIDRIEVQAFQQSVPVYPVAGGRWQALVGIDLETTPGRYDVLVTGLTGDRPMASTTDTLAVAPRRFETRRLTVPDNYVNPPASVLERIQREAERVSAVFRTVTPQRLWRGAFGPPVAGRATSSFGTRSILNSQPRSPHGGTDFEAAPGTSVRAPNAGQVVLADDLYFSGNTVIVDHGLGLYSYLAHLSRIDVTDGAHLATGDPVGGVGATGRVTGPHLHWSVRLNGARVDPLSLLEILGTRQDR